jgi:primosomal protein N' (replication factor Y)
MPRFCQVSLPLPLRGAFDYKVPEGVSVQAGQRVQVPFGRQRLQGVVTALLDQSQAKGLKAIERVLDGAPSVSPALLKFTRWVADYYLCAWGEALALCLPPAGGLRQEAWLQVADPAALSELAEGLPARSLRSQGVLRQVLAAGSLSLGQARAEGLSEAVLKQALAQGLRRVTQSLRPQPAAPAPDRAPALKPAQAQAVGAIQAALRAGQGEGFLLYGVTGSGKTEVYLAALEQALGQGGGAIVLVPEIALTPQTWSRFEARFPGQVAVLHSGLSAGERAAAWEDLRSGRRRVALGPRSALFAPVQKLALLVVDEESEPSYKQEGSPRYHARDAALVRAKLEGAVCVLGSATPSLEAFHNARSGKLTLLRLPGRVGGHGLPTVRFVDLNAWDRGAAKAGDGVAESDVISPDLAQELRACLGRGEQSLLFLNRRGFAPVWACAACGDAVDCGHCSVPMTFHREAGGPGWLRCHLCGKSQRPPVKCPNPKCGKPLLRALGTGTQRLEQEVERLLPGARLQRVDRDSASGVGFHADLGQRMRAGGIDVLLGTQMLAKGLDFAGLTLVGVVNADASLSFPDFRAAERTFQLLVQVAGRAGRADKPGLVLIQTRQPSHACLQAAAAQDFEAFFDDSLAERKAFGYPPFGRLAALLFKGKSKEAVQAAAEAAGAQLELQARQGKLPVEVLGPAPAPLVMVKEFWRYRLLLKSPSSKALHQLLEPLAWAWKDKRVQLAVDVDPLSFL